jgi:transcriptional regulator with XRE-family HTH domain
MKTLGQFIRESRDEKDISLREFAKNLDFSPAFLSDIELGRRFPSNENLERIAKLLRVPLAEIKKYDSRPPAEDLRLLTRTNPQYAFAFRAMLDSGATPEVIMKLAKREREKSLGNKKKK